MERRLLKDTELSALSMTDINGMKNGDVFQVYLDAPIQTNGYFLGYSGSVTSMANETDIYSTVKEKAYIETKRNTHNDLTFNLEKRGGNTILYREYPQQITESINITVNDCIMSFTSGSTTRFLGVNGTNSAVTTSSATAVSDVNYHWDFIQSGNGQYIIYNPASQRYVRFYSNRYSIATNISRIYMSAYTANSGFAIRGASGTSAYYLMLKSGRNNSVSLSSNTRTAQYWKIYTLNASPNVSGTTSGRAPRWSYPRPVTISQATTFTGLTPFAGYVANEILRVGQTSGNTTLYLNHQSSPSNLQYTTGGTSMQSGWLIFNKDTSTHVIGDLPIVNEKQIDSDWNSTGNTGGSYKWQYDVGVFEVTFTGIKQKLIFWMHDGSAVGAKAYWSDLEIYENGVLITDHSKYQNVGFYCNSPKYSITNGCSPYHQANTSMSDGVSHSSTVEFNTSSTVSESINWPLTFKFIGLYFE